MQGAQLNFLAMARYTVFHKRIKLKTRQAKTACSRRKRHIRVEAKLSTLDTKKKKKKTGCFASKYIWVGDDSVVFWNLVTQKDRS